MSDFTRKELKNISKITRLLNAAVKEHSKESVLSAVSTNNNCYSTDFPSISQLQKNINNNGENLQRGHFNWIANTLKDLAPKEKRNKDYSHYSKKPEEVTIGALIEEDTAAIINYENQELAPE